MDELKCYKEFGDEQEYSTYLEFTLVNINNFMLEYFEDDKELMDILIQESNELWEKLGDE